MGCVCGVGGGLTDEALYDLFLGNLRNMRHCIVGCVQGNGLVHSKDQSNESMQVGPHLRNLRIVGTKERRKTISFPYLELLQPTAKGARQLQRYTLGA